MNCVICNKKLSKSSKCCSGECYEQYKIVFAQDIESNNRKINFNKRLRKTFYRWSYNHKKKQIDKFHLLKLKCFFCNQEIIKIKDLQLHHNPSRTYIVQYFLEKCGMSIDELILKEDQTLSLNIFNEASRIKNKEIRQIFKSINKELNVQFLNCHTWCHRKHHKQKTKL